MTTRPPHADPQQEGDDGSGEPPGAGGDAAASDGATPEDHVLRVAEPDQAQGMPYL